MAIKPLPQSIPTKLPPAKLYLDDVTEILQILTDSSTDYQASFVAGKSKCDTLDDLKDLKGRATHFVMDISSPGKHQTLELTTSATRIHIYEIGDQLPAWSKYVNVAAIFEKRKLRLKSAVRSMASWILAGLWLLTGALLMFVPRAGKPTSISQLNRISRPAFFWRLPSCTTSLVRTALCTCVTRRELRRKDGWKITSRKLSSVSYAF